MKTLIYFFGIYFIFINNIFSQGSIQQAEILIQNSTSHQVIVKVFPIGAVFSGNYSPPNNFVQKYSLLRSNPDLPAPYWPDPDYITGGTKLISPYDFKVLDFDDGLYYNVQFGNDNVIGGVSYGLWKFEFYYSLDTPYVDLIADCFIDYRDFNHGNDNDLPVDIYFDLVRRSGAIADSLLFKFVFGSYTNIYDTRIINKTIKSWHKVGSYTVINGDTIRDQMTPGSPNKGLFKSISEFSKYPINAKQYGALNHIDPGEFYLNFQIDHDIYTHDTLIDNPTNIVITPETFLKINSGKIFNMVTPASPSNGSNNLIIDSLAKLSLSSNAKIIVNSHNKLTLRKNSGLKFFAGSEIIVNPGGYFCNEGAEITGSGKIIYTGGTHQPMCNQLADYKLKDSAKFIFDSNAILEIPDSTTLHLTGNTTSLILKPNSKLKFGQNSKILIDSGAKLIANNAEFSSVDSTKKWLGINLLGNSQDTIKNCTIKNADYGVSIANKNGESDSGVSYSTEISGCTFVNETNSALNNGICVYNSNNVLLMNNTITSGSSPSGLVFGIYAEYCPAGNFNIIGNSINNSDKGIALIQSSPYIARNTLNGNSTCESGMLLDNSNGTMEYNTVSDFFYSYYTYYSSPNLLKNTFYNSFEDNLYLTSYSAPVMHPLSSESIINYFAGGNLVTGSPSNSGIYFYDESFPDMDNGLNSFTLSNSTYYINGDIPSGMSGVLFAEKNYWGETPQSSKFGVSGGTVDYSPYESSNPTNFDADYSDLYDIGFGLYDSVLVKDNSDNPSPAEDIYLQAFQKEYSKQYSRAIELYNEIVTDYRDSVFAASSMSRLFNCYEKKNSSYSEFNSLETFYRNIFNDSSYTELLKNISQEFMIKSKVKNNKIQEAIADYDSIYIQNTNTPKGTHALINKEILISISMSTSNDNSVYNSELENMITRQQRIVEILSNMRHDRENILMKINSPVSYSLSQNYPNPFNPITVISYELPHDGLVKLKIYDITGKEILILVNELKQSGRYDVTFNGSNISSGIYFYRIQTDEFIETKRMMLLK